MGKPRAQWNWNTYHRWIKEGRGRGEGKDYVPWLTIHDLASKGISSRVPGMTTGRMHQLLSGLETAMFYILDASDLALDIREQYPLLPLEETLRIADEMGIRHPRDTVSKYPYVFTSDFVVTTPNELKVLSIKPSSELEKLRVREKLTVEHRFWEEQGVEWRLVTEKVIDFQKARNLEWIARSWDFCQRVPAGRVPEEILDSFLYIFENSYHSVSQIAEEVERRFRLEPGFGITTFQYLLRQKRITIDLSSPLDLVTPRIGNGKGGRYSWIETYA
jgi:hypothetical protein